MRKQPSRRSQTLAWAIALAAITIAAYLPATRCEWIWDDDYYVTHNVHLRSLGGLREIWFTLGAVPQYYPVTHTTFWVEYHLWGRNPAGYHVVNILLHATSAILLWIVLRRLAVPGPWLIAAIFAVHPVHVESVAWVTERKNVLSGVLYLAAMLSYVAWASRPWLSESGEGEGEGTGGTPVLRKGWSLYAISLVLFALSLLSKSVTASLPAAILLVVWWKRGRVTWRDVWPLVPMFVLGIAMGALTSHMERTVVGAHGPEWDLRAIDRMLIASRAVWFYAFKLLWPAKLTFIYPRWTIDPRQPWQWAFLAAALALVAALFGLRHRIGRGPLVAVLFFGGTLLPALGFVNLLPMRYSFVADHFQYLASIGLIALLIGAAAYWARQRQIGPAMRVTFAATVLAIFGVLTFRQQSAYANLRALWNDTLAKNPHAWMARNNLAKLDILDGQFDDAERELDLALRDKPGAPEVLFNRGLVYEKRGDAARAQEVYRHILTLQPGYGPAHAAIGRARQAQGFYIDAIVHLEAALKYDPGDDGARASLALAHNNLGLALAADQMYPQAAQEFAAAIVLNPQLPEAQNNLGVVMEKTGRPDLAAAAYRRAIELRPSFEQARRNLQRVTGG